MSRLFATPRSFAEIYDEVAADRERLARFLVCPISKETLGAGRIPWLASDGHLYAGEALQEYAEHCSRAGKPLRSPMTREVLRPWAVDASEVLAAHGWEGSGAGSAILQLPQAEALEMRRGTRRAETWSDALGSACRMLLGWHDGDVIDWWFPFCSTAHEILTPPPVQELLPLAAPLLAWLGCDEAKLANPHHILTASVSLRRQEMERSDELKASRDAPPPTFEELFLTLNR